MLPVIHPFKLNTKFVSMLMDKLDRFHVKEEFGVMNHVEFSSPWPIVIEETSFEFVSKFSFTYI